MGIKLDESKIRDYLAEHIFLLSDELTVVKKEFYLKNAQGTDGSIDILAKDRYDNYVIIEIKRSNQAARQALHEVTKYLRLLKDNFKIKDSEIRIIIASTEWEELRIPFSEYCNKISLCVEGYKLDAEEGIIRSAELDKPIESTFIRKFSRHQCLFLYLNEQSLEQKCNSVFKKIKNAGMEDFVAFHMSSSKDIMYPYGLVVIFQSYNESYYMNLIYSRYPDLIEELDKYEQDNEYDGYLDYLEQNIISESINYAPRDSFEISYPEKLYSAIQEGWEINKIYRFGFFEKDIRTNEWLINEAVGLKGENGLTFEDICETKFNEKFNELNIKLLNYLQFNNELVRLSEMIVSDIHMLKENVRMRMWYYNPNDIIWSLAHMAEYNTIDGLPMFNFYLDCTERDIQYNYYGYLVYSGESIGYDLIKKIYFHNDDFNYFTYKQLGGIASINSELMELLGLHFAMSKVEIRSGVKFKEEKILLDHLHKYSFGDFKNSQQKFIRDALQLFRSYSNRV